MEKKSLDTIIKWHEEGISNETICKDLKYCDTYVWSLRGPCCCLPSLPLGSLAVID